jgi:hypothetical protein
MRTATYTVLSAIIHLTLRSQVSTQSQYENKLRKDIVLWQVGGNTIFKKNSLSNAAGFVNRRIRFTEGIKSNRRKK